jgi:multidrug resistance efflux pump
MESGVKAKEANMDLAERKRTRSGQLYGDNLIPYSDMDDAETTKLLAEMQLRDAQENKKLAEFEYKQNQEAVLRMTIRSPVNGIVMERFHHPGERIENEPILKIAQLNPLNVEMILPTALYHSIKVGMHAQIIPEAPIGGKYTATVKIVDRVLDAASGTFGVRLELPNPDNRLPAGIKCKVMFPSGLLKKNSKNATDSTD